MKSQRKGNKIFEPLRAHSEPTKSLLLYLRYMKMFYSSPSTIWRFRSLRVAPNVYDFYLVLCLLPHSLNYGRRALFHTKAQL